MAQFIDQAVQNQVKEVFSDLKYPVHLLLFVSKNIELCEYCNETQQLLEEVVSLSDLLSLEVVDMDVEKDVVNQYQIERVPGIVIAAKEDHSIIDLGVRISGIPAGHEFNTLINDLILVSKRESGLEKKTRDALKKIMKPVHMLVFTTPTCPYCPRAVVLAHQMAMENPNIVAEMIEAMEFPELSDRFEVSGVPQTTINFGKRTLIGAVPEERLLDEILRAIE